MAEKRTIGLYGLEDNDQVVFGCLLELLSLKTTKEWHVQRGDSGDVIVVDFDKDENREFARTRQGIGEQVIYYGKHEICRQQPLWLGKPLRAADILRCLKSIEESEQSGPPPNNATKTQQVSIGLRLKRWPDRELMSKFPGATRLCAIFMRQTVTTERAASMAALPYERVADFVAKCKSKGYIQEHYVKLSPAANAKQGKSNNSLFGRLRNKFGVRA